MSSQIYQNYSTEVKAAASCLVHLYLWASSTYLFLSLGFCFNCNSVAPEGRNHFCYKLANKHAKHAYKIHNQRCMQKLPQDGWGHTLDAKEALLAPGKTLTSSCWVCMPCVIATRTRILCDCLHKEVKCIKKENHRTNFHRPKDSPSHMTGSLAVQCPEAWLQLPSLGASVQVSASSPKAAS